MGSFSASEGGKSRPSMLGQACRLLGCSARALSGFPAPTQTLINAWNKSNSFLFSSRLLSNGILTPKEGGIGIPPELLSSKKVLTPEHVPGGPVNLMTVLEEPAAHLEYAYFCEHKIYGLSHIT